ncbi:MAG: OadG family transporter subunit [Candidatus Electryonea clarkiae]|nr:OadG family transporter subunit [Candidatus Electryonea clarkiae]MDP8285608.1 OadG family transporter subunit [Candidatus Electryonea clarkiae]
MFGFEAIQQGQGWMLMVVGVLVVFSALIFLIIVMNVLRIVQSYLHQRMQRKTTDKTDDMPPELGGEIPGVLVAAIALTLILEEEQIHDEESMVLTMQALSKPYSNWWMRDLERTWGHGRNPSRASVLKAPDPVRGKDV